MEGSITVSWRSNTSCKLRDNSQSMNGAAGARTHCDGEDEASNATCTSLSNEVIRQRFFRFLVDCQLVELDVQMFLGMQVATKC
eukprot:1241211-Amphidinium_carterae.1